MNFGPDPTWIRAKMDRSHANMVGIIVMFYDVLRSIETFLTMGSK